MEITLIIATGIIAFLVWRVIADSRKQTALTADAAAAAARLQEAQTAAAARFQETQAAADKRLQEAQQAAAARLQEAQAERDNERKLREEYQARTARATADLRATQQVLQEVRDQAARDEAERQQRIAKEVSLAREQMQAQFNREMQERTDRLNREQKQRLEEAKQQNKEQMDAVVAPLKKEMADLRKQNEEGQKQRAEQAATIQEQIRYIVEHDKERDRTTQALTDALKNKGKVQGDWGEYVLADILRDSGLREPDEFECQVNIRTESGANERPDVIVKHPNGSRVVIDSKVSLTAYTDYCGAENDAERAAAEQANYRSVWQHVTELAEKEYEKDVNGALPMVLMFVPNEGAYMLALNHDAGLLTKAWMKHIVIINPTNLMAFLDLILRMWENTRQEKNAAAIIDSATKLYDKFCTFLDGYVSMGTRLDGLRNDYDKGIKQLRDGTGNITKRLNDLRALGVKTTKAIPEPVKSLE